ncbi:hypothetical protein ACFPZ4_19335, partial [Micromonospora harpali]
MEPDQNRVEPKENPPPMPEQPGIDAYAAYLPAYVLADNRLDATGPPRRGGPARGVAAFDEDTVTMAVEALRPVAAASPSGGQLLFATTNAPYEAKTSAGVVHEALGLDPGTGAVDLRGHRSGATALDLVVRAGATAALADLRAARPGAPDEADGGVALGQLVGRAGAGGAQVGQGGGRAGPDDEGEGGGAAAVSAQVDRAGPRVEPEGLVHHAG